MEKIKLTDNNLNTKQPSNLEAEQALLGSIMINNDIIDEISTIINPTSFYDPGHTKIYEVIETLNNKGMIANPITLKNYFEKDNMLNEVGGTEYLVKLTRFSASTKQAIDYAKIIHEMYLRRELVLISDNLSSETLNSRDQSAEKIIEGTEKSLFDLAERGSFSQSFLKFNQALDQTIEMATQAMKNDKGIVGVPTGLTDLDEKLGGLHKSDLVILAGRPSMGKTAFAVNIAENAAIKGQHSVAIFSMEMPGEQLAMRMMSSLGRIDQHKVRTGKLEDDDWPRLTSAVGMLQETRMFIDDTPALTPAELRARCRRISREHGLDLVVVDYLQLMQVAGTNENRATEISEISRSLKAMAKELKVPVIALSQLNRSLESRTDRRPVMSDLRESGAIEQDADVILFIYRDEVYDEESNDKGIAEIIISKQRNGPIGKVKLAFRGQYTRFENLADDYIHSSSGFSK